MEARDTRRIGRVLSRSECNRDGFIEREIKKNGKLKRNVEKGRMHVRRRREK